MGGETRRIHTTPIPPGRRGSFKLRATGLVCVSCSHAEIDDRKANVIERGRTVAKGHDTPQDRPQRHSQVEGDRVVVLPQKAQSVPAVRFRVPFDRNDRSQRCSNSIGLTSGKLAVFDRGPMVPSRPKRR